MIFSEFAGRAMALLATVFVYSAATVSAFADDVKPKNAMTAPLPAPLAAPTRCDTALDLTRFDVPLRRVSQKIAAQEPVTIVAIGSSSTAGAGATSPDNSYPSRLGVELRILFPGRTFNIINKGVNGEEVPDMLRRFDEAVIANKPDLVLWQLGTNSLIRDHEFGERGASIREGLTKVRATGADIVLVDPQYAPKVVVKPKAVKMVNFLSAFAKQEGVALYRRFHVMKRWADVDKLPFSAFITPDDLHLNDWGYGCMAKGIGLAIADAVKRPIVAAETAR